MPSEPIPNQDRLDMGGGVAATRYRDGSIVFWKIEPPNEQVAYLPPGGTNPADLQNGKAATVGPDGSIMVYDIANPPPEVAGQIPTGATPGAVPAAPANPRAPTGAIGTRNPGEDFNYGTQRPGPGVYPGAFGGTTVSPNTAATRGAGVEGTPYGWGVPGFGQNPIQINPDDLPDLFNPKIAPGYIPGSGTYNQFRLDSQNQAPRFPGGPTGLFWDLPLRFGGTETVNSRFGLGGTGDPTNGSELQTPERWITGAPTASMQPMQGDAKWRATGGTWKGGGGGGGGFDIQPYTLPSGGAVGMGGGGMGGGFFGSTVTSNWGQTPETAGKDYIGTLFLRSDTPTGIGTPAWSAPQSMWDGLAQEIAAGRITIKDPQAWQMLAQKGYTPQNIGGAASGPQNVAPGGVAGTGSTEDAIANANAAAAADRAAYWAYQQSILRQGDQRIAMEAARDAWTKEYQTAGLTGQVNGQDTFAKQQWQDSIEYRDAQAALSQKLAEAGLLGTYEGQQTLAKLAQDFSQKYQEAGLTGTWNGQKTQAAIGQENQTALALMGLQSNLRGPRNWDSYQTTFGSTPQGLKDVMGAFQGRYALPGATGANGQAQGGRATVSGLAGDILSGTYQGNAGQEPEALTNPYQADVRNWSRMQPSQREMVLGRYENQGWYGDDFTNMLNSAAPKYAGAQGGNFNLFQS